MVKPMIPALAKAVADAFPELGGRCLPVTEVQQFNADSNVPTLPIAIVALGGERGSGGNNSVINIGSEVIIEFILKPTKYQKGNKDTPFFAYYDYEPTRNGLLALMQSWRSPGCGGAAYQSMNIESDEFAVYLSFTFVVTEQWSGPEQSPDGTVVIVATLPLPIILPCEPVEEPADPCGTA